MLKITRFKTMTTLLAVSAVALSSFASTTASMARPVADFVITISKQGGKPSSFKTGKNGYVWQAVEAGKYSVKAGGKEIVVEVGREGKLWIKVDQNAKGQTSISADGGAKVVLLNI